MSGSVSVNVHVVGDAAVDVRQAIDGSRVWLEVGGVSGSVGFFFDRAGLDRVREALGEMSDRMPALGEMAAA